MCVPTSREPVKEMNLVLGWLTRKSPISPPPPGRKLTTPAGMPASSSSSTARAAMIGVRLAGLRMAVLPVTMAAAATPRGFARPRIRRATDGLLLPAPTATFDPDACVYSFAADEQRPLAIEFTLDLT